MTDTIYNDLKQQGLILSQGFELGFPSIKSPKRGLLSQIASYMIPQQSLNNKINSANVINNVQRQLQLIIQPILNNCFIIARSTTLLCYKYQMEKQSSKPIISKPHITYLPYKILKIHICDMKYLNDRSQIPIIIQSSQQIILFYIDLKQLKLIQKHKLKLSNFYSARFICDKEFVILTKNDLLIHHIIVQNGKMKIKQKFNAELKIQENQQIVQINIVGNIDQQQKSTICLFYYLKIKNNQSSQILKLKEYSRSIDGIISSDKDYTILNNQYSIVLTENYDIMAFEDYYCLVLKHDVLILKKKFQRYLFIDNVMEKTGKNVLKLHQNSIITTHSGNSMELNVILFGDPKCYSKLLDNIQINQQLSEGFLKIWPFKYQNQTSLMFVFKKDKRIVLFNLIKMDPNDKMLMIVQNTPKQQLTKKLMIIQQIAVNLGITKKNFYLHQWFHSKRQLPQIYTFLLPCQDIPSIKKQLRMTMRKIKIQVTELLKILQKLGKIIKNQLQTNLSQNLLKQYIKNDFLYRKLKLKDSAKRLDHRQMDKVYNSSLIMMFVQIVKNQLYPCEKQQDPLHAMVQPQIKQQTNLHHVFQMFKMVILQDYKNFLVQFISQFNPSQIVQVITTYHYLLPIYQFKPQLIIHQPQYMTQVQLLLINKKTQKNQPQQFSDMTSIQFNKQLSKQRIQKQLHDYYPNSKLHEAINNLIMSQFGVQEKLKKHGLISLTMREYKEKLKQIEDIKLFLKVCEHVNQYNLNSNHIQDELSIQLVEIFKNKNKLTGKAYETVRLYTSMHRFMLKNNFYQKKILTTEQLMNLTSQDLVALFFLQNRQRKQFIFKQFRDLFVNLYQNPYQFNLVIDKFINSQNCSRIQLQIFISEIKQKGETFQIQNQQLIQLIIDGFCKKLQIRQDNDTCRFLQIMQQIQLCKKLAMKINKIIQIRKCVNIFNVFNCQKQSYYNMLKYEQNNKIFRLLLQKYFNDDMKRDFVRIQDQEIALDYCRSMLIVLLYLQQNVYYDISSQQLLLTYCQVLIEWKQFQVLKGIIYDQKIPQKLQFQQQQFVIILVSNILDQIYQDQQIIYDDQTKQHIRNILEIIQGINQIKIRQYAKLELVQIFQPWGNNIHCNDMKIVVKGWAEGGKRQFIEDLINQYINNLTFQIFAQIYIKLEISSGKLQEQVNLQSQQFIGYSLYYADKLLQQNNYNQIITIISFVKMIPQIKISYALISQTFLKTISSIFIQKQQISKAKQAIQYFTQYFNDEIKIQRIFAENLQNVGFNILINREQQRQQREQKIQVNPSYCIKNRNVIIQLQFLWQLSQQMYIQKNQSLQQLYYSYYFLIMIFRDPEHGFSKNHKISYNLQSITDLLFKLDTKTQSSNHLWAINPYSIFKRFKRGLYLQAITRIRQINSQQFKSSKNDQTQLEAIKNRLKQDKQNNSELLKCLTKVQSFLANYKVNSKKIEKANSNQIQKNQKEQVQSNTNTKIQQSQSKKQIDLNITLNLRKFRDRKLQISNASMFNISQRDILQQIYQLQKQQKQQFRKQITGAQKSNKFMMPFLNMLKSNNQNDIEYKLLNQKYDQLQNTRKQDLIKASQSIFYSNQKNFFQLISIFDSLKLKIIDNKKIQIGRLCKIYQQQFTSIQIDNIRKMIPFNYLIQPSESNDEQFKKHLYSVMSNSFEDIVYNKNHLEIQNMASFIGKVFNDNSYSGRFYVDVVRLYAKLSFCSETVVKIRKIMHVLSQFTQEVSHYYRKILDSYQYNHDLLLIIKHQLIICLKDLKNDQIQKDIHNYQQL